MIKNVIKFTACIFIVLIILIFLIFSNKPEFRYSNLSCIYNQIYINDINPNILFLGTSRLLSAINPDIIEKKIYNKTGKDYYVVNASTSWRGYGQIKRQLIDFIDQKKIPKIVIIELSEISKGKINYQKRFLRKNLYYEGFYPEYEKIAKLSDFFDDFQKINESFYIKLHVLIESLLYKFIYLTRYINSDLDTIIDRNDKYFQKCYREYKNYNIKNDQISYRNKRFNDPSNKNEYWKANIKKIDLNHSNFIRSSGLIKDLIEIASQNEIDLFFVYVPRIYDDPISDSQKNIFKNKYGVDLFSLEPREMNILYSTKNSYRDITHMMKEGRKYFSDIISDYLINNYVYK